MDVPPILPGEPLHYLFSKHREAGDFTSPVHFLFGDEEDVLIPVDLGGIAYETGESLYTSLTSEGADFSVGFSHGESITTNVTNIVYINLNADLGDGALIQVDLRTDSVVPLDLYLGSVMTMTMIVPAMLSVASNMYTGESLSSMLVDDPIFANIGWHHGQSSNWTLTQTVNPSMSISFDHGESFSVYGLIPTAGIPCAMYTGESVAWTLNADIDIPSIRFGHGEALSTSLKTAEPLDLVLSFSHGESLSAQVSGDIRLNAISFSNGEMLTIDVTMPAAPLVEIKLSHGESFGYDMRLGANMGHGISHGESLVVSGMETDDLWRLYHGEYIEANLSTSVTIPRNFETGEVLDADLTIPLRESFSSGFYDGQNVGLQLVVPRHQKLYANFSHTTLMTIDIDSTTRFDLRDRCCGGDDVLLDPDYHTIELYGTEAPDEFFHGHNTKFTAGLTTAPRFSFSFSHGSTMKITDAMPYLPRFDFFSGSGMHLDFDAVQNVRLCYGNFIPDGDRVFVELDNENYPECDTDRFYHGSHLQTSMGTVSGLGMNIYDGSRMEFDLEVPKPLGLNLWHGTEFHYPSQVDIVKPFGHGESLAITIYQDPWVFPHGQSMAADIVIKYDVRLLETGCLDNEYLYQDDDGNPLPELSTPVAIEMSPYQHDVKAICE